MSRKIKTAKEARNDIKFNEKITKSIEYNRKNKVIEECTHNPLYLFIYSFFVTPLATGGDFLFEPLISVDKPLKEENTFNLLIISIY